MIAFLSLLLAHVAGTSVPSIDAPNTGCVFPLADGFEATGLDPDGRRLVVRRYTNTGALGRVIHPSDTSMVVGSNDRGVVTIDYRVVGYFRFVQGEVARPGQDDTTWWEGVDNSPYFGDWMCVGQWFLNWRGDELLVRGRDRRTRVIDDVDAMDTMAVNPKRGEIALIRDDYRSDPELRLYDAATGKRIGTRRVTLSGAETCRSGGYAASAGYCDDSRVVCFLCGRDPQGTLRSRLPAIGPETDDSLDMKLFVAVLDTRTGHAVAVAYVRWRAFGPEGDPVPEGVRFKLAPLSNNSVAVLQHDRIYLVPLPPAPKSKDGPKKDGGSRMPFHGR